MMLKEEERPVRYCTTCLSKGIRAEAGAVKGVRTGVSYSVSVQFDDDNLAKRLHERGAHVRLRARLALDPESRQAAHVGVVAADARLPAAANRPGRDSPFRSARFASESARHFRDSE